MPSEKYKEFRNLMFNELGITKDDVRQWTKEAVMEAAERRVRSIDVEKLCRDRLSDEVRSVVRPRYGEPTRAVQDEIRKAVAQTLAERLTISTK